MTHSSTISFAITCFPFFIFIFLSNSKYCSNNFSSRLPFSIPSFFIILLGYFLNIICYTIFLVVPLIYFGSFPILIRVFCYISIFTILFSKLSSLFSTLFIVFKASSNKISIFCDFIMYFFFFLPKFEFFPKGIDYMLSLLV